MTQLYTVTMHRKQRITVFGDRGKSTVTEKLVEETYGGLPHSTALGYLKLDPAAIIVAEAQAHDRFSKRQPSVIVAGDQKHRGPVSRPATKKPIPIAERAAEKAAPAMDYSDLVNSLT